MDIKYSIVYFFSGFGDCVRHVFHSQSLTVQLRNSMEQVYGTLHTPEYLPVSWLITLSLFHRPLSNKTGFKKA